MAYNLSPATPELILTDGKITTSSKQVARSFGKRHSDVMRAIKKMEITDEYRERHFALTIYDVPGPKGAVRQEPAYCMTRDGFALLAMGFTGGQAMRWKIAYLDAFNAMEENLMHQAMQQTIPATMYEQALQIETREARSFALAQAGAYAMLLRKSEKKELVETVALMREAIQLRLALGYSVEI